MIRARLAVVTGYTVSAHEKSQCLPGDRSLRRRRIDRHSKRKKRKRFGDISSPTGEDDYGGLGMGTDLWSAWAYAIIDAYEKNGQLLYDQFTGVSTPTMIDQDKFLHNLQNETYINIILGDPLEEFDRFVEQW